MDLRGPEIEDAFQLAANPDRMGEVPQPAPARVVRDVIAHVHAPWRGSEVMLVMPESIGTDALFIDEGRPLAHIGDFRDPPGPESGQETNPVFNPLPGVHPGRDRADNPEAHVG